MVITGLGVISPLGLESGEFWANLVAGRSGIAPLESLPVAGLRYRRGGEVRGFLPRREWLALATGRCSLYLLAAGAEAWAGSGLGAGGERVGVVVASNFGDVELVEDRLGGRETPPANPQPTVYSLQPIISPAATLAGLNQQTLADALSRLLGARGPSLALSLSCSSGGAAIAEAFDLIRAGRADVMVAGGADALSLFAWSGLSALRAMTSEEMRPFDRRRSGTLFSEGAGVLVLEDFEHARRRGARMRAEMLGYGSSNNVHHMAAPPPGGRGLEKAMRAALEQGGLAPEAVDHINAHGTATPGNDATETAAIKAVFGAHARDIAICSIKAATGHTMGAAGAIEAIAAILTLEEGLVPPTLNYGEPDPACDLDYTPNEARRRTLQTALSNSSGIGGNNVAVLFRRFAR